MSPAGAGDRQRPCLLSGLLAVPAGSCRMPNNERSIVFVEATMVVAALHGFSDGSSFR